MAEENKEEKAQGPQQAAAAAEKAPATLRALMGQKVGMSQIFTKDGERRAVTVVRAGPCPVVRVKGADGDGYSAVLLGFGDKKEKNIPKAQAGQFQSAGVKPLRWLKEFRVADAKPFKAGQVVDLQGRFTPGDYVDVQGTSKGKGFQGAMKRHGFAGLPASHGASDKERSPGSLTSRRSLGRVLPGQRMAGHTGHETVTIQKIEVVAVEADKNLVFLNGSVPGPKGGLVVIQETVKSLKRRPEVQKPKGPKKDKMGNIIQAGPAKGKKK